MADRPGDDVLFADEVRLVLALLEGARKSAREIAADGRLLGYDECLAHEFTLANGFHTPLFGSEAAAP
jgi:hypothetical protein